MQSFHFCSQCSWYKTFAPPRFPEKKFIRSYLFLIRLKIRGMRSWVAPPPRLPHPAAVPFATPKIRLLNMVLTQNWQVTNEASEKPMKKRAKTKPVAEDTVAMENTAGAVISSRVAHPYRGPTRSHTVPMINRERIVPEPPHSGNSHQSPFEQTTHKTLESPL
jgi:hypothetical protein